MPRQRWRDRRGTFREHSPLGARVAALSASTLRLARGLRHFPRALPAWREGCGTFRDRHSRFRHQSFKVVPASADAVPSRVPARHLGLRGSAAPRQAVSPSLFRSTGGGRESLWFDFVFIFSSVLLLMSFNSFACPRDYGRGEWSNTPPRYYALFLLFQRSLSAWPWR